LTPGINFAIFSQKEKLRNWATFAKKSDNIQKKDNNGNPYSEKFLL
jgi:hypothetical protein